MLVCNKYIFIKVRSHIFTLHFIAVLNDFVYQIAGVLSQ